tara:strand:- start:3733 stop:3903 length:171 start_codon:yes stop_codon:yes gene_type:complete
MADDLTMKAVLLRDILQAFDFNGIAIVEQDMYPCDIDTPLPIAKRTREYLKEIGIG